MYCLFVLPNYFTDSSQLRMSG